MYWIFLFVSSCWINDFLCLQRGKLFLFQYFFLPPSEGRLGSWKLVTGGASTLESKSENRLQSQNSDGSAWLRELVAGPGYSLPRSFHPLCPPPSPGTPLTRACLLQSTKWYSVSKKGAAQLRAHPQPLVASPPFSSQGPPLFGACLALLIPRRAPLVGLWTPMAHDHSYSTEPVLHYVFMTSHST